MSQLPDCESSELFTVFNESLAFCYSDRKYPEPEDFILRMSPKGLTIFHLVTPLSTDSTSLQPCLLLSYSILLEAARSHQETQGSKSVG